MTLPQKPKLKSLAEQGYVKPQVKKVVINEPPGEDRPYYMIPGGDLSKAWEVNKQKYLPAVRLPAEFGNNPPYAEGWDKLSPMERGLAGGISGSPAVEAVSGTLQKLSEVPWIGAVFNALQKPAAWVERALGYSYQAAFDPSLRGWDAAQAILQGKQDDYLASSDPNKRKIGAAWQAAGQFYETSDIMAAGRERVYGGLYIASQLPSLMKEAIQNAPAILNAGILGGQPPALPEHDRVMRDIAGPEFFKWYAATGTEERVAELQAKDEALAGKLRANGWTESQIESAMSTVRGDMASVKTLDMLASVPEFADIPPDAWEQWIQATTNLTKVWEEQFVKGEATTLGGLPELIEMRKRILAGVPYDQVQQEYIQSLQGLALRAQMSDLMAQVGADPLNLVPMLKAKDWMHGMRATILSARVAPEVVNAASDIRNAARLAATAIGAADEVDAAVRAGRAADAANDFIRVARQIGLEDFTKVADQVESIVKIGGSPEDIAKAIDQVQPLLTKLDEMKQMSRPERVLLAVTGGDPFNPNFGQVTVKGKPLTLFGRQIGLRSSLNPFALSAAGRTDEFLNTVYHSVQLVMKEAGDDVEKAVDMLKRGASGAFGGRFGHMMISPIGRHVQFVLKQMDAHVTDLLTMWVQTDKERSLAHAIARAIGTDIVELIEVGKKGGAEAKGLFDRLKAASVVGAPDDPALMELFAMVARGDITEDTIFTLGKLFDSTPGKIVPYTPALFRASVIRNMAETIVKIGQESFGLKGARWLEKAVVPIKAVESLVLLGLSPLYPIRNFFNNEVTMMARGVSSLMMPRSLARLVPGVGKGITTVEDVMDSFGVDVARFHEGFGIQGADVLADLARGVERAEEFGVMAGREAIRKTVWGTPKGITGKIIETVRNFKDFRQVAAAMERLSSQRAFTVGMLRAWGWIWPRTMTQLDDFNPSLAARLDEFAPGYADLVTQAARASRKPEDLIELMTSKNIRVNLETVLKRTAEAMGVPPERVLQMIPEETVEAVRAVLKNLGPTATPQQVEEGFTFLRSIAQQHVDELVMSHMEDIAAEAIARIETQGQAGLVQVWGELTDRTTRRHYAHMERLDDTWEAIYKINDPAMRSRMVRRLLAESDEVWTRHWKYERALRDAMVKGFAARGSELSQSWLKSYDELQDANRAFYKLRNELWEHWWEGTESKSYDDLIKAQVTINEKLDDEYIRLTDMTDGLHSKMDDAMISALYAEDSVMSQNVRMWRDLVRLERRKYMEDVLEFRRSIRGLPPEAKQAAWIDFHGVNREAFRRIQNLEKFGMDMLNGDPKPGDFFALKAYAEGLDPAVRTEAQRAILSGGLTELAGVKLTDAQQAARAYAIKTAPMTPERRRLQQLFAPEFRQEVVEEYVARWATGGTTYGKEPEINQITADIGTSEAYSLEGAAGGTQGAMWYRHNVSGQRFVVKVPEGPNRAATEALANRIYQRLGIEAPETYRVRVNGAAGTSAAEVKGQAFPSIVSDPKLRRGFVADAYLANHDVMGLTFDNIIWDSGGNPWRVDQGGTMFFRAQGGAKDFGPEVRELETMLDPAINPNTATAYGSVSAEEMRQQAQALVNRLDDAWIDKAVDSAGFDVAMRNKTREALKARRDWLMERFELPKPKAVKYVGLEPHGPQNFHEFLDRWINSDGQWKQKMIDFLEANPGAAQEAQDLAQWWLYENGFTSVPLYNGKLRVYRGKPTSLKNMQFRPYDSLTPRMEEAKKFAGGSPVIEFEIPVENVLTHQQAHGAFRGSFAHESEFILNERGFEGARVVSINGHPPTEAEIDALRALNPDLEFGATITAAGKPSIDFDNIVGPQRYDGLVEDDMMFEEVGAVLDNMERSAISNMREPPTVLESLPEDLKVDLTHYLDRVSGDLNDARLASIRMAEGLRDSALLNYNARYNYDNWLSIGMPFEFWWTHSMMQWAASVIDRPAWLAQYSKTRDFLHNAQAGHRGFPSRLRGRVRIPLPFAPKEMGDAWVDPFSAFGGPLEQFVRPFERWKTTTTNVEQRTTRKLDEMVKAGEISQGQYDEAVRLGEGPTWNRAKSLVLEADKGLEYDLLDFMNLSISPHVPISMAWNVARGKPEQIGVLPHTRTLRNVGAMLGVDPGVYDRVWGNVRKAIGLPAFDQWDDYRVDRQFGNMLGENGLSPEDALKAMTERSGPAFDEARKQSARTEAVQWGYSLLGLPVNFYPPGEEHLREITPLFFKALDEDDKGNPYPLRHFFEKYPEYEVRLALWKTPEERLKTFMSDWIYDRYYNMPDINKSEVREALGDSFVEVMLDKETRNPQSASVNVLGMWMRMMGGEAPGQLATDALPIPLTRPDIAQRLQVWYDYRDRVFPGVFDMQSDYFKMDEGSARSVYRTNNPMLPIYWQQRREFMSRNPDLAPYIEEDPKKRPTYGSEAELREAEAAQPNYSWDEWTNLVSFPVGRLIMDYVGDGQPLPASAIDRLNETAEMLGLEGGWQAILDRMVAVAPDLTQP